MRSFLAAFAFYTVLPTPRKLPLNFDRVARWLPVVGLVIGFILGSVDLLLNALILSDALRSLIVVVLWLGLTGGFHLDGAMDSADGLAVSDPDGTALPRRLEAMADSYSGAFGVMAAIVIILLKTFALNEYSSLERFSLLVLIPAWGRWAQLMAIAIYPYLKPKGKGRFLKDTLRLPWDVLFPTILLVAAILFLHNWDWQFLFPSFAGHETFDPILFLVLPAPLIALGVSWWFYRQFGGHTGDTYGAVVEWTEMLLLLTPSVIHSVVSAGWL